jgi:hypothetical protein
LGIPLLIQERILISPYFDALKTYKQQPRSVSAPMDLNGRHVRMKTEKPWPFFGNFPLCGARMICGHRPMGLSPGRPVKMKKNKIFNLKGPGNGNESSHIFSICFNDQRRHGAAAFWLGTH